VAAVAVTRLAGGASPPKRCGFFARFSEAKCSPWTSVCRICRSPKLYFIIRYPGTDRDRIVRFCEIRRTDSNNIYDIDYNFMYDIIVMMAALSGSKKKKNKFINDVNVIAMYNYNCRSVGNLALSLLKSYRNKTVDFGFSVQESKFYHFIIGYVTLCGRVRR